jgi:hypothetical protein
VEDIHAVIKHSHYCHHISTRNENPMTLINHQIQEKAAALGQRGIKNFANKLIVAGLSVIPVAMPSKQPTVKWKEYSDRRPKLNELDYRDSIGVICGTVSKGLEVIDIDLKHFTSRAAGDLFLSELESKVSGEIIAKLVVQKTVSGGRHWIFRCETIGANQHLARMRKSDHQQPVALIETRGQGGFIVTSPTKGYEMVRGSFTAIQQITPDEREQLFEACRSMNQYFEELKISKTDSYATGLAKKSPWEDYNQRGPVQELLHQHGWTQVRQVAENLHYSRPGKLGSTSGTWNGKLFYCFTSSSVLEPSKAYSPAALFTYFECNKDFSVASVKLRSMGYGVELNANLTQAISGNLFRVAEMGAVQVPKKIFGSLWSEGENAFLFAEDGAGKSILATQIASSIATGVPIPGFVSEVEAQNVMLLDTELSPIQFNNRYPTGLPDNLRRVTFDDGRQSKLGRATIGYVVGEIERFACDLNASKIILDNLASLTSMIDCTRTNDSIELMGLLNDLKKKGFSILIIDHCRKPLKESEFKAISKHDLQGSKMKTNLVDSVFSIGMSSMGKDYRYLKSLKTRSFEMEFARDSVATLRLRTDPLRFEFSGLDPEWDHVNDKTSKMLKMQQDGRSQAEIANCFNVTQQYVSKKLRASDEV